MRSAASAHAHSRLKLHVITTAQVLWSGNSWLQSPASPATTNTSGRGRQGLRHSAPRTWTRSPSVSAYSLSFPSYHLSVYIPSLINIRLKLERVSLWLGTKPRHMLFIFEKYYFPLIILLKISSSNQYDDNEERKKCYWQVFTFCQQWF